MTLSDLNISAQCREFKVELWACPHFLFVVMGFVMVSAIMATDYVSQRYTDQPEISALVVLGVTAVLFIISHIIVQSFERVARAARAKAEFIAIISHQLRSPLTAIQWFIESLQADPKNCPPPFCENLSIIHEHSERMMKLVNELLEVNRIEEGRFVLKATPGSLLELTKQCIRDWAYIASQMQVRIELAASAVIPQSLFDTSHTRWVVENLINNSIHYARPDTTVRIRLEERAGELFWSVTNQGAGIAFKDAKRIFEKFFRSSGSSKLQTEGSGLGLFIAKSIIEAAGGKIGFTSQENHETTFWFTLPTTIIK